MRTKCSCAMHVKEIMAASQLPEQGQEFASWVKSNGGDEAILKISTENGFNSVLSLRFVDVDSADGKDLLGRLNYGQQCLLQGLIKLSSGVDCHPAVQHGPYAASISKAEGLSTRIQKPSLSQKLGKLFHRTTRRDDGSSADEFEPVPAYKCGKRKRQVQEPKGKGPAKKKGRAQSPGCWPN